MDEKTPVKPINVFRYLDTHKKPVKWKIGEWLDNVIHFNLKAIIDKYGMDKGSEIIAAKVEHHTRRHG